MAHTQRRPSLAQLGIMDHHSFCRTTRYPNHESINQTFTSMLVSSTRSNVMFFCFDPIFQGQVMQAIIRLTNMVSRNRNTKLQGKRILPRNFFSIHRSLDKVGVCLLNFEVKSPSIDRVKIYRNCLFKQKCRDRRTISSFPDDRLMRVLIVFVCSEATNLFSGF